MTFVEAALVRRNATLPDMADLLRAQHDSKLDVVVPAAAMRSRGGLLEIDGTGEAILTPDGVTSATGRFWPTGTCDGGPAEKLGIPLAYLRRTREQHPELYDVNVNTWLADEPGRRLLVRALRGAGPVGRGSLGGCCPTSTGSPTTSTCC